MIYLYTYQINKDMYNYGEMLASKILTAMGHKHRMIGNERCHIKSVNSVLFSIGGLLNKYYCQAYLLDHTKKIYVWGSGFDCDFVEEKLLDKEVIESKFDITMIRGPLTRDAYDLPKDLLLGDIGFLTSLFYPFDRRTENVLQVPFYADKEIFVVPGVTKVIPSLLMKDSKNSFDTCFNELLEGIATASFVLTGSMHAAITAMSYNVPWAIIAKEGKDPSKEWKWHDVLGSVGLDSFDIKCCDSLEEGVSWWNSIKNKIRPITREYQQQILDAFPY